MQLLRNVGLLSAAVALATVCGLSAPTLAQQVPDQQINGFVEYGDDASPEQQIFHGVNRWSLDPAIRPKRLVLNTPDTNFSGTYYISIRFNDNVAWDLGNIDGEYSWSCAEQESSTFVKTLKCTKTPTDANLSLIVMNVQDDVKSIDWAIGTDDFPELPPADAGNNDSWTSQDIQDVKNGINDVNKNLTDPNVNTDHMSETIAGIKIQPVGILSTAITAVVKLPTLLTNKQACQPINIADLYGHKITVPCVSTQVNHNLWTTCGIIADFLVALAIFYVVVKIATSIYLAKEDPVGIAGGAKQ